MRNELLLSLWSWCLGALLLVTTSACTPNEAPFRTENEALKKQLAKQESLLTSLQDGNKVMQQQIDLLNQELREAKTQTKRLSDQLEVEIAEAKRTAAIQIAQFLKVEEKGAHIDTLPHPIPTVAKVVEEALARNGYQLKVSAKTDQKAVYVTERKVSTPTSLEIAGFRNQYLISLQALPDNITRLMVKAEFEKIAQGGRILSVSAEETKETERRLIGEINKGLDTPSKT